MEHAYTLLRHLVLMGVSLAPWADEKMEGIVETSQQAGGRQNSPLLRVWPPLPGCGLPGSEGKFGNEHSGVRP